MLLKFGGLLLERVPPPHLTIHLETTAEACLARGAPCTEGLSLDDMAALHESVRSLVGSMADKGCEVFRRKWDGFGKAAAIRDTILCAEPPPPRLNRARPSEAAVDRILRDAWAASQPTPPLSPVALRRSRVSRETRETQREDERGLTTPETTRAVRTSTHPLVSATPGSPSCDSPEGSPGCVFARFEDLPTREQFASVVNVA